MPAFEGLADAHDVALVVTRPARGRGAGRNRPVAEAAAARRLPVVAPDRARDALADIATTGAPIAAVVAYGQLLPPELLAAFPLGLVNLHFSLLPRWRGAAPVEHAIWAGDEVTGVTTMLIDEGMDTGAVLDREEVAIGPDERAGELTVRLARLGAPLLVRTIDDVIAGRVTLHPQDDGAATTAPKLRPEQGRLDWRAESRALVRQARAFHPRPGAFTTFRGRRFEVHAARPGEATDARPGVLTVEPLRVAAADRWVVLDEVQLEGRRPVVGPDFARGARIAPGETVG